MQIYVRTKTGKIQVQDGKEVTRTYVCSRCIARDPPVQVPMLKGKVDPDIGETMTCPVCHWMSRRPTDEPLEVV